MKRKILFYDWQPVDGPAKGGVTSYLKELLSVLVDDNRLDIWFLSSGRKYISGKGTCIQPDETCFDSRIKAYEVVNSPVLAPGRQSIRNFECYLHDRNLLQLIDDFISRSGGFDIVHYHNWEGLSLRILELKRRHPSTQFIYTFHNYYPICPQVNLWQKGQRNCQAKDFMECADCFESANYDLTWFRFQNIRIPKLKEIFLQYSIEHPDSGKKETYRRFREENISGFNKGMDLLIAVSDRCKEVLVNAGLNREKIRRLYVGTQVASMAGIQKEKPCETNILHLLYLGYMTQEKGFYFFLRALKEMPENLARSISVTIVARYDKSKEIEIKELNEMGSKFHSVQIHNGYRDYEELQYILKDQDLGIVPILWEDNLPRVAVEQIAYGVPILTSDLGGASELGGRNPAFVFRAGDISDFIRHISDFVEHRGMLEEYWKHSMKLITMKEHASKLLEIYGVGK